MYLRSTFGQISLALLCWSCCVPVQGQVQAGVLLGAGWFTPEERSGYAHQERLCPEFGLSIGLKAGRSRLGLAVIHSSRNTIDRLEGSQPTIAVVEEEQRTRSVAAGLYALFPLTREKKRMHVLVGPALDLVFPYRTDVRRLFTDLPELDVANAYVNYTPPGLRAGLRAQVEWRFDPMFTPFAGLGFNHTFRQTFTEVSEHSNTLSAVTPPTDRLDYHLWLGVMIALGGVDCDCPAFH